jgi:hypothetical protein
MSGPPCDDRIQLDTPCQGHSKRFLAGRVEGPCQNAACMKIAIVATVLLGLYVDQQWPIYGQDAASLAAWILCIGLWLRVDARTRVTLAACLIIATTGEVFLSLICGLYRYRLGNIPLFVPPGHVLLFYLGTQIAPRLSGRGTWAIAVLSLPAVAYFALAGRDTLSPWLFALYVASVYGSPSRALYSTMFVLSLAMELFGTWIGNWTWSAQVPGTSLVTTNPPLAAGAFYCALDLLVLVAASWREKGGRPIFSNRAAKEAALAKR